MKKEQIAAELETAFSQYGFAEPNVAKLKDECGVSLRTLYKYFPSKEAMIVGALEYRHQRYLSYLTEELPDSGIEAMIRVIDKLEHWMREYAPTGCMSIHAMAAFPNNKLINQAVTSHKQEILLFLADKSQAAGLANPLYLVHEGLSNAWPVMGDEAVKSAKLIVSNLLKETD